MVYKQNLVIVLLKPKKKKKKISSALQKNYLPRSNKTSLSGTSSLRWIDTSRGLRFGPVTVNDITQSSLKMSIDFSAYFHEHCWSWKLEKLSDKLAHAMIRQIAIILTYLLPIPKDIFNKNVVNDENGKTNQSTTGDLKWVHIYNKRHLIPN